MAEQKPDPNKPKPAGPGEIPVGKLVGSRPKRSEPAIPTGPTVLMPAPPPPPPEFDVELVAVPYQPPRKPREQRSLFDLDRRDFIMLGAGVGGSILAVIMGLVMAKLFQRKPADEPKTDK